MKAYLVKRLLQIVPTLLGITFITFLIIQLAPGNPAVLKLQMVSPSVQVHGPPPAPPELWVRTNCSKPIGLFRST